MDTTAYLKTKAEEFVNGPDNGTAEALTALLLEVHALGYQEAGFRASHRNHTLTTDTF